jgi:hypothetical protein
METTTGTAVDKIIDNFVGDVAGLFRKMEVESLTVALSQASTRLRAELPGKTSPDGNKESKTRTTSQTPVSSSAPRQRRAAKETSTSNASNTEGVTETSTPTKGRRAANSPVRTIVAGDEPKGAAVGKKPRPSKKATATLEAKKTPSSEKGSADVASRDAAVLEALRVLGESTAADVAKHTGRSKTACYMAAQRLIEEGELVKTTSGRTILYRLTSSGGVRPFKRARSKKSEPSSEASAASRSMPRAFAEVDGCAGATAA